jgi:hypothetical protein
MHPLWWAALALLVLNDHLLKAAGGVEWGWLTGKLSDFAGMLVAPAILAVAARVRTARGWLAAHLAVGAVFSAIKVSATAAALLPVVITVDPSDLAAVPLLLVSWRLLGRAARDPEYALAGLGRLAFVGGSVACMATSSPPPPMPPNGPGQGSFFANLTLTNQTSIPRNLRVRPLAGWMDCEAVAADPASRLSSEMFGPAEVWRVEAGQTLPLTATGQECDALLVDGEGIGARILWWTVLEYPTSMIAPGPETPQDIQLEGQDQAAAWEAHPVVRPAPLPNAAVRASCGDAGAPGQLYWSPVPPSGTGELTAITQAPNGCYRLDFGNWGSAQYLCLGGQTLRFRVGEWLALSEWEGRLILAGPVSTLTLEVGPAPASIPLVPATECSGYRDACGAWIEPWVEAASEPGALALRAPSTRTEVLAAYRVVSAPTACVPDDPSRIQVETLTFQGATP